MSERNLHPIEIAWRRARKSLGGLESSSGFMRNLPVYLERFVPHGMPEGVVLPSNLIIRTVQEEVIQAAGNQVDTERYPIDQIPLWMSVAKHPKDKISRDHSVDGDYQFSRSLAGKIIAATAYAHSFWAAYRISKRIYCVNPLLWEGLAEAKFPSDYPAEMLHLTAPAIALDLGSASVQLPSEHGQSVRFIYLSYDLACDGESNSEKALNIYIPSEMESELRLVASLNLDRHATLKESWESCIERWKASHHAIYGDPPSDAEARAYLQITGGTLNTLLYILGENEIAVTVHPGVKPPELQNQRPMSKAKRLAVDLAHPEELEIGGQYAAKVIEFWGEEGPTSSSHLAGKYTGQSVRPHIRSAHAHLYWTGVGKTIPIVKFLPPIAVKGAIGDERLGPAIAKVQ